MVDHPEQMPNLRGSVKTLTARLVVGKSTAKPQLTAVRKKAGAAPKT